LHASTTCRSSISRGSARGVRRACAGRRARRRFGGDPASLLHAMVVPLAHR